MTCRASPTCPACGTASLRVHSRYRRKLEDLPWEGLRVRIVLETRRFFCVGSSCRRKIFTEPLSGTVARYARRSCRSSEVLKWLTLALGGPGRNATGMPAWVAGVLALSRDDRLCAHHHDRSFGSYSKPHPLLRTSLNAHVKPLKCTRKIITGNRISYNRSPFRWNTVKRIATCRYEIITKQILDPFITHF